LSKLEQFEEEQLVLRRVEREEIEVEEALEHRLHNIAHITNVHPVDPAIDWKPNPAQQVNPFLNSARY